MSSENSSVQTSSSNSRGSLDIQYSGEKWEYTLHHVEHVQQRFNWDCGVACVMMLLSPQQRQEFEANFDNICAEEGFHQSTWTVDLCYLLKRFGINHTMYSIMLGVNEEYKKYSYYDNIFDLDRERVERRFSEAHSQGIVVEQGAVSSARLLQHLRFRGPAIALVDAGYLACDFCKRNKLKSEIKKHFGGSYTGHYVLAVGVHGSRVLFRDPAQSERVCAAPAQALQRARDAPGTDQDLILVHQLYRPRSKSKESDSKVTLKTKASSSQTLRLSKARFKQIRWSSCAVQ